LQRTRLKAHDAAIASWKAARALDPDHPAPPEAIARAFEASKEPRPLRAALVELAASAATHDERARLFTRAGEIDELSLGDDAAAAAMYGRALTEAPGDEMLLARLLRVLDRADRVVGSKALETLLPTASASAARAFQLAQLLVDAGDTPRATEL